MRGSGIKRPGSSVNITFSAAFFVLSLFCTPFFAGAEEEVLEVPRLTIVEPEFDFGAVSQGSKIIHDFEVKNTGTAALDIQRIVPACGCTASSVDNPIIAPGESGKIHVEFDTSGFSGEKLKTVRMYTNDPDQASALLRLRGVVEPDVSVNPQRVYFGTVTRGSDGASASKKVNVTVREGSDIGIIGVKSFSKSLVVEEVKSGAKERQFVVSVDPEVAIGELRERVVISLKGGKRKSINVPVFASVKGALQLKPTSVAFGILDGEKPVQRSIKLQNRGKEAVKIVKVKSSHPAVSTSFKEVKDGYTFVIHIAVDPAKVTKDLRTSIEVETTSEEQKELSLSVYGILPPST